MQTRRLNPVFAPRGFSLMELVLVLAIIGVLMAVAAYSVFGQAGKADLRATKASLSVIKGGLDSYYLEYKEFPPDLKALVSAKFIEDKKLQDAWKREFIYEGRTQGERRYSLGSSGPDQQIGTPDDIDVYTME